MGVGRVLALVALFILTGALPAAGTVDDEHAMLLLINDARAQIELEPLTMFGDLVDDARHHTDQMIESGDLYHSTPDQIRSYTTEWALLGENVGLGPNTSALHRAFMLSESHADNVLGDFSKVGIGARRASDGSMYVTILFMQPIEREEAALYEFSPVTDLSWFSPPPPRTGVADRIQPNPIWAASPTPAATSTRCAWTAGCVD